MLIIGGCRSGKSSRALAIGEKFIGPRNFFVATCQPHDDEMAERIKRHQKERAKHWLTIESPLEPDAVIADRGSGANIILIDCLTLWVSNLMMAYENDTQILKAFDRLYQALTAPPCPIILVTNEVGLGIVPENATARRFRDLTGWCNQKMASVCREVIWMVAGIAVPIQHLNRSLYVD